MAFYHEKPAMVEAMQLPAVLHGPFGYLVGAIGLDESHWRVEDDPVSDPDYFSLPMFTRTDPFHPAPAPAKPAPVSAVQAGWKLVPVVDDAWRELCERDDCTSPAEYPDMCLITHDELAEFMSRAALTSAKAPEDHPDDIAVDRFAVAMKTKLAKKRSEGRGGWDDKEACSNGALSQMLVEHVRKGDPVDVANFAMMIHERGERIDRRAMP